MMITIFTCATPKLCLLLWSNVWITLSRMLHHPPGEWGYRIYMCVLATGEFGALLCCVQCATPCPALPPLCLIRNGRSKSRRPAYQRYLLMSAADAISPRPPAAFPVGFSRI
uniref:Putative secreted protein n=1 Tax=Anopheles marajoara TaxID=58244 RepID=A0A2M4C7T8_9DIPT